jgi:hypothetical protein
VQRSRTEVTKFTSMTLTLGDVEFKVDLQTANKPGLVPRRSITQSLSVIVLNVPYTSTQVND